MVALDLILIGALLVSLVIGAWRGLVYELISLAGWIAAFFVAQYFAPDVAAMLPLAKAPDPLRYAAGFAIVFIAVAFGAGLVAWGLKKLVEAVGLRPVDRVLGGAFGLMRAVVLMLAATVVVNLMGQQTSTWWSESKGAGILEAALKGLKPVFPEQFGKFIP